MSIQFNSALGTHTAPYQARCAELERELAHARTTGSRAITQVSELRAELGNLDDMTPRAMAARIRELEEEAEKAEQAAKEHEAEHEEALEEAERRKVDLMNAARAVLGAVAIGQIKAMATYEVEVNDLRKALEMAE